MATKGTAWVLRRCTDLVPYLLFAGLREYWPARSPQVVPPVSAGPGAGLEIGHAP
jgi:hypothetical protein